MRYVFWNNKGGTGKTNLAFQVLSEYAINNPDKSILAIDLCPQANLSELLLGGLLGNGSTHLDNLCNSNPRKTIGGYFEHRITSPFKPINIDVSDFLSKPIQYNANIPDNVDLLAGDRLLEIQNPSLSSLANTSLPNVNTRLCVLKWVIDFLDATDNKYDTIFIDTNPSFALHTQMGIMASDRLLVPIMADDSSRRAIENLFALVYGLNMPQMYAAYQFSSIAQQVNMPKFHLIIRNRITQYMGEASAYGTVLNEISNLVESYQKQYPTNFTFSNIQDGSVSVKDFGTAGVVAYAKGTPYSRLRAGKYDILGNNCTVNKNMLQESYYVILNIVSKL